MGQALWLRSAAVSGVRQVRVGGSPADFTFDPNCRVAHGEVCYGPGPIVVEVVTAKDGQTELPRRPLAPDDLAVYLKAQ